MNYGIKLKEMRELYELSQQDIANFLQIARSTYNQYEQQYDTIPIKHLNELCNYYKISIDYVLNLTKKKNYIDSKREINPKLSGKRLKELRTEFHLTQGKLANILNIANTMICEYEKGNYPISTSTLYALYRKFNISIDYLLGKTNKVKYLPPKKELITN